MIGNFANDKISRFRRFPLPFSVLDQGDAGKFKLMPKITRCPVALTIAGSDSGAGAGIQADLKTFAAFGIHGTSAIACLTAQNPRRILAIESCSPAMLRCQIEAVFENLHPAAVKTGMLLSAENVRAVAGFFKKQKRPPLIVDPVMASTSGAKLLTPAAIAILKERLLPLAMLVTPNLAEAEVLSSGKIASVENMRAAARKIRACFGCAALVKGGHLRGMREAVDVFYDGRTELLFKAPFIHGIRPHGTGCTYSAAITAMLALGYDLPQAVRLAKNYITRAIARSFRVGNYSALNHLGAKSVSRPDQSRPRRS